MSETRAGPARWLVPAALAVVVLVLVVVALVRDPQVLDPATPEGVVQTYLQAISDQRWEDAYAALDPAALADCDPLDISASTPSQPFTASLGSGRGREPEITTTNGTGPAEATTRVGVTLRFGSDGLFSSSWETSEIFRLVDKEGRWLITGDPWPYFSWACGSHR